LNKCDLLPHLAFDLDEWSGFVRAINPKAQIMKISAMTGDGIDHWLSLLEWMRTGSVSLHENRA